MGTAEDFKTFLGNIAVDNHQTIELRYGEITAALNKKYRDTESKTANSLQVGSYGRWTAIKGVSDLDMLYLMPARSRADYDGEGGQSRLLKDAADAISARYPTTTVKVDRLVVRVLYTCFHIEVQPVFERDDGGFDYPDTYGGGSWKVTRPREEHDALADLNGRKNRNARRLCKMARAWRNRHGVAMGGLLIDTLVNNFLEGTDEYDTRSYLYYDWMVRDFFAFLKDQPDREHYAALGSRQRVKVKKKFQKKAAKAHDLCLKAIEADGEDNVGAKWRKVFGRHYPAAKAAEVRKAALVEAGTQARDTEEFFEDVYAVDVRNYLKIDCEVSQNGFRDYLLRPHLLQRFRIGHSKSLRFHVVSHDVQQPYKVVWKVTNRGPEAVRRNMIRGQLLPDAGREQRTETSSFRGDHVVDCAIVKNGVVVALDRISVPIE
ncbi:MAG: hypothetical protein PGN16_13810 [Sphingomonas phyllosphaerae]|uniref:SMODS domain-containing nucleotidyltransferase n=1 Tax=Sphingomonas phyllosphaerae TaxID=257003 RepID=UPI002FF998CA